MAQVCVHPAETLSQVEPGATCTGSGVGSGEESPIPSSDVLPQHQSVALLRMPQVCTVPPSIETQPPPAGLASPGDEPPTRHATTTRPGISVRVRRRVLTGDLRFRDAARPNQGDGGPDRRR